MCPPAPPLYFMLKEQQQGGRAWPIAESHSNSQHSGTSDCRGQVTLTTGRWAACPVDPLYSKLIGQAYTQEAVDVQHCLSWHQILDKNTPLPSGLIG